VAIAEAVKMADAVMMHTDADRTDVNVDAGGRGANTCQGNHTGDESRLENVFHFPSVHFSSPPMGKNVSLHHSLRRVPSPENGRDFGGIAPRLQNHG